MGTKRTVYSGRRNKIGRRVMVSGQPPVTAGASSDRKLGEALQASDRSDATPEGLFRNTEPADKAWTNKSAFVKALSSAGLGGKDQSLHVLANPSGNGALLVHRDGLVRVPQCALNDCPEGDSVRTKAGTFARSDVYLGDFDAGKHLPTIIADFITNHSDNEASLVGHITTDTGGEVKVLRDEANNQWATVDAAKFELLDTPATDRILIFEASVLALDKDDSIVGFMGGMRVKQFDYATGETVHAVT